MIEKLLEIEKVIIIFSCYWLFIKIISLLSKSKEAIFAIVIVEHEGIADFVNAFSDPTKVSLDTATSTITVTGDETLTGDHDIAGSWTLIVDNAVLTVIDLAIHGDLELKNGAELVVSASGEITLGYIDAEDPSKLGVPAGCELTVKGRLHIEHGELDLGGSVTIEDGGELFVSSDSKIIGAGNIEVEDGGKVEYIVAALGDLPDFSNLTAGGGHIILNAGAQFEITLDPDNISSSTFIYIGGSSDDAVFKVTDGYVKIEVDNGEAAIELYGDAVLGNP